MSKSVQVSKKVLFALCGLLLVSLTLSGYLFGRQSVLNSVEEKSPSSAPSPIPVAQQAEQSLDSRVSALQGRVGTLQQRTVDQAPPLDVTATPTAGQQVETLQDPTDLKARLAYFERLDSILGRSAFSSPQPFATRLIEQAMSSDRAGHFEAVLTQATLAMAEVETLETPPTCSEHKRLVVGQLKNTLSVLLELKLALQSGNIAEVGALSEVDESVLSEAASLRKLDSSLRPQP